MGAVYKADADKRRLGAENLRIHLVEHFPAQIIIAIAGGSGKARVRHPVILKRSHYLLRVFCGDLVYLPEFIRELCFDLLGKDKNFRFYIIYIHLAAP